ncbi:MAG: hypothetical protein J6A89_03770 [Clostridia bacterium]|nr:hypothetical protein [Clostridia bacterium]
MMKDLVMEVTREVTNELPENASAAQIIDAIIVRLSAIKGFKDIEEGNFTTQEQLLKEIKQW